MDMKIVRSLADHIVSLGWPIGKLTSHLEAAELGYLQAVAAAADKGITAEELRYAFRLAIDTARNGS